MQRREFSAQLLSTALFGATALGAARPALAQTPAEGTQYIRLNQPAPVSVPAGKIEVVEFFWYGCPHCNAFAPFLEAWAKKLPADVTLRMVPVAFQPSWAIHQKLFFALESMKLVDSLHRKVFYAIHNQHRRLDKEEDIVAFMNENGVDGAKVREMMNSFSMQAKVTQARRLLDMYRIDGVPALGIHGRFYTSPGLSGGNENALTVADYLIQRVRKGG